MWFGLWLENGRERWLTREVALFGRSESPGKYPLYLCPTGRLLGAACCKDAELEDCWPPFLQVNDIHFLIILARTIISVTEKCDLLVKSSNWVTHCYRPPVWETPRGGKKHVWGFMKREFETHVAMSIWVILRQIGCRWNKEWENKKDVSMTKLFNDSVFLGLLPRLIALNLTRGRHMSHLQIVVRHMVHICAFVLCRTPTQRQLQEHLKINKQRKIKPPTGN